MPAVVVTDPASGNALTATVDDGVHWSGAIVLNRVDPSSGAETGQFSSGLPAPYVTDGQGLTDGMWNTVTGALTLLKAYVNFNFVVSDALDANYFVSDFTKPSNLDVAGITSEPGNGSILAFNRQTWDGYSSQIQQWIVVHELDHLLGERHSVGLPPELDFSQYTVMSGNWYQLGDFNIQLGLPLTPMALDVAMLQAKYGAASANLGATTYSLGNFGTDLDGSDGFVQNGHGYICVWDSAGVDTISFTGGAGSIINLNAATLQTAPMAGDLAEVIGDVAQTSHIFAGLTAAAQAEITDPVRTAGGFFSSILAGTARAAGGFTIAHGADIENGTGGFGNDLIVGNALDNTLRGNDGDDNLYGGAGNDQLDGGLGDDQLFGGSGSDTLTDIAGQNYLRGEAGDDVINGGAGFDDANGNTGNDTIHGGAGDDYSVGGKDNDVLFGDAGNDIVWGNLGNDTIDGGDGNDQVRGGQGDDIVNGGAGDDFVSGDRGNDTTTGGAGADIFHGSQDAGIDRVLDFHLSEGDRVLLDPGTTYTLSQVGADTVIDMGGGANQMILVGVQLSSLTPGWIFGA
jgi:Ca2+-binding RTX toxin-like protein